ARRRFRRFGSFLRAICSRVSVICITALREVLGGSMRITVTVDGTQYTDDVEPRLLLVHYLRDRLGKVVTVVGCDTSNYGACTVLLDDRSVKSCSVLARSEEHTSEL